MFFPVLANELQSLEPQLRQLCALDCRMYILPLIRSGMQMNLLNVDVLSSACTSCFFLSLLL